MDYPELSGVTISERDKAFAQEFANFVNGSMSSPDQTGRELTRRTATCNSRCSKCSSAS